MLEQIAVLLRSSSSHEPSGLLHRNSLKPWMGALWLEKEDCAQCTALHEHVVDHVFTHDDQDQDQDHDSDDDVSGS